MGHLVDQVEVKMASYQPSVFCGRARMRFMPGSAVSFIDFMYSLIEFVIHKSFGWCLVASLETRVSKTTSSAIITNPTSTTTIITAIAGTSSSPSPSSSIITSSTATKSNATSAVVVTTAQQQPLQPQKPSLYPSQLRPAQDTGGQIRSKPKQRKLQFKLDDEGSPDKKPKEKIEDEGIEDEESGWWAERVAMALGGMTEYRDAWYKSHAHLLHGDGPLPHTWRLYIAALAVCRHEVSWLMQALLADFRNAGGDMRWTVDLRQAPPKLYALTTINNILAHRPWLLSPQHIQALTKGEDSWSLGELCHALCIMTHFHTLATFLHGCKFSILHSPSKKDDGQGNSKSGCISKISPRNLQARSGPDISPQNNNATSDSGCKIKTSGGKGATPDRRSYIHLTVNPAYTYDDLVCKGETEDPPFFVQDYNWQDHGYAMCSRLLGQVAVFFDDRFTSALAITVPPCKEHPSQSNKVDPLNNPVCDPAQLKRGSFLVKAVWNHVQWLLGIHHDDCDYNEINKLLDAPVREFIKTACCFPETLADTSPLTTNSVHGTMVEMSVIVMEARLQSELLYALRAIMLHHC